MVRTLTLLMVGLGLLLPQTATAGKDHFEVGERVPAFTLKTINKKEIDLSHVTLENYFGTGAKDPKKATIISFFATYCKPCKKEIPFLSALYDAYNEAGLQVLLVSIDKDAPKQKEALVLANKAKVKFPVLGDRYNIVARRYYIEKLPCLYILDGDGKVAFVNTGYDEGASLQLLDEVHKAIGISSDAPVPEAVKKHLGG